MKKKVLDFKELLYTFLYNSLGEKRVLKTTSGSSGDSEWVNPLAEIFLKVASRDELVNVKAEFRGNPVIDSKLVTMREIERALHLDLAGTNYMLSFKVEGAIRSVAAYFPLDDVNEDVGHIRVLWRDDVECVDVTDSLMGEMSYDEVMFKMQEVIEKFAA